MGNGKSILIVGAGISGLTLALALKRGGFEVQVAEVNAGPMFVNAGIMLGVNALKVFAAILPELAGRVESRGLAVHRVTMMGPDGRTLGELDFAGIARHHGVAVSIHRARLQEALLEALGPGTIRYSTHISAIEQSGESVRVCDMNRGWEAFDLVVGADGAWSQVRELVFTAKPPEYIGATSWRFVAPRGDLIHHPVEIWGEGERLGLMPISEGFVHGVAVVDRPIQLEDPERGRLARLRERFEDYAWIVPQVLESLHRDDQIVHQDLVEVHLSTWCKGRVALIGDAAHAMTPSLRQGAGMGVEDALVMARKLTGADDVPTALKAWERARRPRVGWVQRHSRRVTDVIRWHSSLALSLRDEAIAASPQSAILAGLKSLLNEEIDEIQSVPVHASRGPGRILIVGAGIAGLAVAHALECQGLGAKLIERGATNLGSANGLILYPTAVGAFRRMGVELVKPGFGCKLSRFRITDAAGKLLEEVNLRDLGASPGDWIAMHRDVLLNILTDLGTARQVRHNTHLFELEERPDGVIARFRDGLEERYDLIIGADGLGSQVRRLVFGSKPPLYTGIKTWRFVVDDPMGHLDGVLEMWGSGKRLGFAPIGDGRVLGYATMRDPERWPDPPKGRLVRFRERFEEFGAPAQALLEGLMSDSQLACRHMEEIVQPRWVHERVALVGDAAHALPPTLSQGSAMAAEDALVLAGCLVEHSNLATALASYEEARKDRVARVREESRAIGRISHRASWLGVALRAGMMRSAPVGLFHKHLDAVL